LGGSLGRRESIAKGEADGVLTNDAAACGGEPDRVYAESVIGPTGVDVRLAGILHFPGGVTAELNCGFTSDHNSLEAIGTHGWGQLPDPFHGMRGVLNHNDTEIRTEVPNPYRLELENIGAAIRGEGTPLLGRADAMGQARTLEALYRSAATGAPVTLLGARSGRARPSGPRPAPR